MDAAVIAVAAAFLLLSSIPAASQGASLGVNFGRIANDLPSAAQVAQLVQSQGISDVKIYDADASILSAFAGTGVGIWVMLPNEQIASAAASVQWSQDWISSSILPFYPATTIAAILVGNEVLTRTSDATMAANLVPAMANLRLALQEQNLAGSIRLSTPHAFDVLEPGTSYPPSSGTFKASLADTMTGLLSELQLTGSPFLVDVYPYFAFRDDPVDIPLPYALLDANATSVTDSATGLTYSSLFDAQLDAMNAALQRAGHASLAIVVSETGWPSAGDAGETAATPDNAVAYNRNLVERVSAAKGTPMRPDVAVDTFIFELFNEDQKTGSASERNFGLFYPNMTRVGGANNRVGISPSGSGSGSNRGSGDVSASLPACRGKLWIVQLLILLPILS